MNFTHIFNTGYEVMLAALISNITAQIAKTIVNAIRKGAFESHMLYSTGGMPSSHSSTVTAAATAIGIVSGFDSSIFALSVIFSLITMYDAQGVRMAAGHQAAILNQMLRELFSQHPTLKFKNLKELLGHTPMQVLVGAMLGIGVAFAWHFVLQPNIGG